ncbi:hypothetical protein ACJWDR_34675 [Streptomyces tauricus]|uniref:hypothetical protein n=1 Tax=Streptomyces tauricus TaxID=68274 RepID=UPI00387F077A
MANLDRTGLAAQGQVLDGLPTLATGVVQVMTGFHIAGGIAAMLHGAFRMADPDSSLTRIADACRKALTPDLTVIQESVRAMAPLPDNDRGGLRDALSEAARQIIGVEVGALKHQLFPPGTGADQPASPRRTPEARDRKTVDAPAVDDTSRDAGIGLSVESAGRGDEVSGPTAEEIAKYARDHPPPPVEGPSPVSRPGARMDRCSDHGVAHGMAVKRRRPHAKWGLSWCPRGDLNPHAR